MGSIKFVVTAYFQLVCGLQSRWTGIVMCLPPNDEIRTSLLKHLRRYQSALAIVKGPQQHAAHGTAEGELILFGGKDNWRRLDDLWRLGLRSLYVTTSQHVGSGGTSRPPAVGSWPLAEMGRDERCAHVLVGGTANDTWHASCGRGADGGGGDGSCTMTAVLEMAWCLGEYQSI